MSGESVFDLCRYLCGAMLFLALGVWVWAILIMGILAALREWFGIDLLSRWRKRK